MNSNRLYVSEWLFGLGGGAVLLSLGLLAIANEHILLGAGRSGVRHPPQPLDGPSAVWMGVVLLGIAWWLFGTLLRTSRFRRLWMALELLVIALTGVGAHLIYTHAR